MRFVGRNGQAVLKITIFVAKTGFLQLYQTTTPIVATLLPDVYLNGYTVMTTLLLTNAAKVSAAREEAGRCASKRLVLALNDGWVLFKNDVNSTMAQLLDEHENSSKENSAKSRTWMHSYED
jgi:hypothetical protein